MVTASDSSVRPLVEDDCVHPRFSPWVTPSRFLTILIGLYSLACIFAFFPPTRHAPFVNTAALHEPVISDDYLAHYTEACETVHFFKQHRRLWGYNPWFMAGYPAGVYQGQDNRWSFLCVLLLGRFGEAFAFNLSILTALLAFPWLAFGAASGFGMRGWNRACYVAIATYGVFGFAMLNSFVLFGGIGFAYTVFASLLAVACLAHAIRVKTAESYLLLGLATAFACFVHILGAFLILTLGTTVLIPRLQSLTRRDCIGLPVAAVACTAANLIWIIPFLRFQDWRGSSNDMFQTPLSLVRQRYTTDLPLLVMTGLLLMAVAGMIRQRRWQAALTYAAGSGVMFLTTFLGSQLGLGDMQPGRFAIPLLLFIGLALADQFQPRYLANPLALALLVALIVPVPYRERLVFRIGFQDPDTRILLDAVRRNVPPNARLHVQDSFGHPYFRAHFPAYIPHATGRAILAGPYGDPIERLNFTQFVETRVFDRELKDHSPDELRRLLDIYNISHLLIWDRHARRMVQDFDFFDNVFSMGEYNLYRYTSAPLSFCQEGSADVRADFDQIVVRNASPGGLVLKFHYMKTLRVVPDTVAIEPVQLIADDMPFIRVRNGACSDFAIVNP